MDGISIVALLMVIAAVFLYLLPWVVAAQRGREGHVLIGVLNILLGWTVLGWLALLIIAFTGESEGRKHQRDEELRLLRQMAAKNQES
ncbi:superinfection immunity protein [Lysobacter olei]